MLVVCMDCENKLYEKEPFEITSISHGLCPDCTFKRNRTMLKESILKTIEYIEDYIWQFSPPRPKQLKIIFYGLRKITCRILKDPGSDLK